MLMFALLALLCAWPAAAGERLEVRLGAAQGLDVDSVGEVVIGEDGLLWVGTATGVRRYDGRRFEAADPDATPRSILQVAARPGGGVYVADRAGRLFEIDGQRQVAMAPPPDGDRVYDLELDAEGRLWALQGGRAWRRGADGAWTEPLASLMFDGEGANALRRHGPDLVVATNDGVIGVVGDRVERWVHRTPRYPVMDGVRLGDGSVLTLTFDGALERWRGGVPELLVEGPGRGIALHLRRGTTWVAWAHHMGRVPASGPAEHWRIPYGGPLAGAPDGAMLMGGAAGLRLWPDPDTVVYGTDDGMPGTSVRFLIQRGDALWISTWANGGVRRDGRLVRMEGHGISGRICPDGQGRAWSTVAHHDPDKAGIYSWEPGQPTRRVVPMDVRGGCDSDEDGTVYLGVDDSLWRVVDGAPARIADLPIPGHMIQLDSRDRIWIGYGRQLCHAALSALEPDPDWACLDLEPTEARFATDVEVADDGTTLISTDGAGLLRVVDGRVERHPGSDRVLGTRELHALAPSPRGGVWVLGSGSITRVRADTLEILERLGPWHGVPRSSGGSLVERADGELWIGTATGLVRVPPEARVTPAEAPAVRLVEVRVDGQRVEVGSPTQVGPAPNRVQLVFAALAYRDPARLRYRVRVGDGPMRPLDDGTVQLVDLPSGRHTVAVQASLDGLVWSQPVSARLRVAAPWWQSPWVLGLGLLAVATVAFGAYRARIALLLARERERTRIAMDLHDELGSGLGSIRLIAGVLDREELDDASRHDLASRVRATAGELHGGLQELVGSLRPGGANVGALLDRLSERARDLFPDNGVEITVVEPPGLARTELSLAVRRELERIGAEALHNAARHGRPSRITVGIAGGGPRWRLWVSDDGAGFDVAGARPGGLGLASMRTRASRIGATLELESSVGRGTTITVSFRPLAADTRKRRKR
jgi:signal transduction histidine kinase